MTKLYFSTKYSCHISLVAWTITLHEAYLKELAFFLRSAISIKLLVLLDDLTQLQLTSSNSNVNIRKLPAEYPSRNILDGVSNCKQASSPHIIALFR